MKYNIEDYLGKQVSKDLEVVGLDDSFNENTINANHWFFKCSCGKVFSEFPSRILSGHKKSCGCKRNAGKFVHGLNGNEFYHTWYAMMQRCYNPTHHNYKNYGARGICVCEEWHSLENFIKWAESTVGRKQYGLTVDRIDNNGNYCPQNCKWSTFQEQRRNSRQNRFIEYNGETKCLTEWAQEIGISKETLGGRLKAGWSIDKALTTPLKIQKSRKKEPVIS